MEDWPWHARFYPEAAKAEFEFVSVKSEREQSSRKS
jgi:hypothetical protein